MRAQAAALRPVLLVPGWSDTPRQLLHAERFFLSSGWSAGHVQRLGFNDRYGCNEEHAREIADAVDTLRHATGAAEVDVVAHSMGGLAVRRYLLDGRAPVRNAVFAGTPHNGTLLAHLAWGRGGAQMRPGSRFLQELATRGLPEATRLYSLRTPFDLRIMPGRSAWLDGTECIRVGALRHQWLLRHRPTLELIRDLLTR